MLLTPTRGAIESCRTIVSLDVRRQTTKARYTLRPTPHEIAR
jgi:hypothetical protein